MKRTRNAFASLLCVIAVSCAKNSGPVTGAWSVPTNGLQTALRVPSGRVKAGDEVAILAVYRNQSTIPCKLPSYPYYTINQSHNGKGFADAIGSAKIADSEPLLQPDEERAFRLTGLRTDINGPGMYCISGGIGEMDLSQVRLRAH